jgi:hypothetical protein
MSKNIFTKDFYKKVYDEVFDACKSEFVNEDGECYGKCYVTINIDGYEIDLTALVECEWSDDSFDHAFGTWHDPFAGYEFSGVYGIEDVTVWDEDGNVVEGFSINDYDSQFVEEEHGGIKKGDKVRIITRHGKEYGICEVICFNTRTYEVVLQTEKRGQKTESWSYIMKVA